MPVQNFSTAQGVTLTAPLAETLSVQSGVELIKSFSSPAVLSDGQTPVTLTLTLRNRNLQSVAGGTITDPLPTGMRLATNPNFVSSCAAGSLQGAPGASSFSVNNLSLGAAPNTNGGVSECALQVDVVLLPVVAGQNVTNTVPAQALGAGLPSVNSASATVLATPVIVGSKAFAPSAIVRGATSLLTITLRNTSATPAQIQSFTDSLLSMGPNGAFLIAASPAPVTNCTAQPAQFQAPAGGTQITLSGGTIPANATCLIRVGVSATESAPLGVATNTVAANAVVTTLGNAPPFSAELTVQPPAVVSKEFSPAVIGSAQVSRLTITVSHRSGAPAFTGLNLTDDLASMGAGFVVATPANASNTCGGSFTAAPGSTLLQLSGGFLPAGDSSCQLAVNVQAPAGTGSNTNTIAAFALSNDQNLGNPAPATATLTRTNFPNVTLSKGFSPSTIRGGEPSVLQIIISNVAAGSVDLTGVNLDDNLPAGMVIFPEPDPQLSGAGCTLGSFVATPNGNVFGLRAARIAANSQCTLSVRVTGTLGGNLVNVIPNGTMSSQQGVTNLNPSGEATATLAVQRNINIAKGFSPSVIDANGISRLRITIFNSSDTDFTGSVNPAALVDNLPAGVTIAATDATTNCAGGSLSQADGSPLVVGANSIALSGGSFPQRSNCSIEVSVTSSAVGVYLNTIPANSLITNQGSSNQDPANATLRVVTRPTISKAFTPDTIGTDGRSTLVFTLSNPNSAAELPTGFTGASFSDTLQNMRIATPGAAGGSCVGASSNAFAANATALSFSGLRIPPSGSCTVSVVVTSNTLGVQPNTVSGVLTDQTQTAGAGANANLTVLARPIFSKRFLNSFIQSGGSTVLELRIDNPNDAVINLASPAFTDIFPISPGPMRIANPPALVNTCGGSVTNASGGALAIGDTGVRLSGGSVPVNGSCVVQVAVTATTLGTYLNSVPPLETLNAGASAGNAEAALTVGAGTTLAGYVYLDANTNGSREAAETWAGGTPVFVNLVQNGSVLQSLSITPGAGSDNGYFQFQGVEAGNYQIVVAGAANSTVAASPAGFRFVNPTNGSQTVTLGSAPGLLYNFGLINSITLSGRVFEDTGASANDAIYQADERGIPGVILRLTNCVAPGGPTAITYSSTSTGGDGRYQFSVPPGLANNAPLCVEESLPSTPLLSSGASIGTVVLANGVTTTVAGADYQYRRSPGERIRINYRVGVSGYSEVNFAEVPANSFTTDNQVTASPGSVVFHGHQYTAGSRGTVVFSTTATATPAVPGWAETLFTDANCNGQFDQGSDTALAGPQSLNPDQTLCLLVREFVPANAPSGANNLVRVAAIFSYSGTNPNLRAPALSDEVRTQTRTDTTLVGTPTGSGLKLSKAVDQAIASPGTVLTYTLSYRNDSPEPLSNIEIKDTTPSFTVYVGGSAGCTLPLPATITSCSVTAEPANNAAGNFSWSLGGSLLSGASGNVSFQVRVAQ